jgi:hypothetical protein
MSAAVMASYDLQVVAQGALHSCLSQGARCHAVQVICNMITCLIARLIPPQVPPWYPWQPDQKKQGQQNGSRTVIIQITYTTKTLAAAVWNSPACCPGRPPSPTRPNPATGAGATGASPSSLRWHSTLSCKQTKATQQEVSNRATCSTDAQGNDVENHDSGSRGHATFEKSQAMLWKR